jgi:hypothetical protein
LIAEVEAAGDLRVCLSNEDWGRADLEGALRTVDGVGGDRPHVVASARRLDKLLPSQWQQRVKMRRLALTYEEWLSIVLGEDQAHPAWQNIWVPHDIRGLVERWSKAAGGPENFTLVVADETDHGLLPRVFERMLGLPGGLLSSASTDVRNPSLSYSRIETIRRVNDLSFRRGWPHDGDMKKIHDQLVDALKRETPWPGEERIPPLPTWAAERVREMSERRVAEVRSLGVRVVGDPAHLLVPEIGEIPSRDQPVLVSSELAVRMIEHALDLVLEQRGEERDRQRQRLEQLQRAASRPRATGRPVDETPTRELLRVVAQRATRRARQDRRPEGRPDLNRR